MAKTVWERPIPVPAYLMDWGAGASPIVYRDMVIYNQDDDLNPMLFALDSATGAERLENRASRYACWICHPRDLRSPGSD